MLPICVAQKTGQEKLMKMMVTTFVIDHADLADNWCGQRRQDFDQPLLNCGSESPSESTFYRKLSFSSFRNFPCQAADDLTGLT